MTHKIESVTKLCAKFGRRKAIARLSEEFPHLLVKTMAATVVCEKRKGGRHYDLPRDKRRAGAVITACETMVYMLYHRARMEGSETPIAVFYREALERGRQFCRDTFDGQEVTFSTAVAESRAFKAFEHQWAGAVWVAFQIEMHEPDTDETRFWRDIFLGMSDADPSGVLGEAARLVFLDHSLAYDLALKQTIRAQSGATHEAPVGVQ